MYTYLTWKDGKVSNEQCAIYANELAGQFSLRVHKNISKDNYKC